MSERVLGACIEVHRHLGPGLLEFAYEECLCHEPSLAGLSFARQRPLPVVYKGVMLDCGYRLDVVIEEKLVLELDFARRTTATPTPSAPDRRDPKRRAVSPFALATDPIISRLPASPPPCESLFLSLFSPPNGLAFSRGSAASSSGEVNALELMEAGLSMQRAHFGAASRGYERRDRVEAAAVAGARSARRSVPCRRPRRPGGAGRARGGGRRPRLRGLVLRPGRGGLGYLHPAPLLLLGSGRSWHDASRRTGG
ncbi:MAG: GxxExxY protein [Polyangiaceae bacterium]|nr:GxxExxY protein [Polyangiaceae bacterium]